MLQKKRKVDSECRVFNQESTSKYCHKCRFKSSMFDMPRENCGVQGVRQEKCLHANYAINVSSREREEKALKLSANLIDRQNIFTMQLTVQESATKVSYMLSQGRTTQQGGELF